MTGRHAHILLLVAPLVATLSGCTSIELALGLRTRLDSVPVSSLSASLSPGPALEPGQSACLIIVATTTDGKQLLTVGAGHGEVLFDSFDFSASLVTVEVVHAWLTVAPSGEADAPRLQARVASG